MMNVENECATCACNSVALANAWKILTASKQRNFVAVQVSPAVRVSIGEKFGLARGEDAVGKLVAMLKLLGADAVVDAAIALDVLTLLRLKKLGENKEAGKGVPVYSSECSAWVAYAKENYPEIELLPTATTVNAKLLKKHFGIEMPDKKIRVIALEMGEAKKCDPGVDVVLTLDELAYLINGIDANVRLLKKQPLTAPLGTASGSAYIMGASGGDAESLARCLTSEKTQLNFRKFEYSGLYGKGARREATICLNGADYTFAVVDSLDEADALMQDIQSGAASYDYVEVTACAGGAIGKGCDLATPEGEMTRRLRKLGLKYLDFSRAARSAEVNAAAVALLKQWNALCRSGEADAYDVIDEIVVDIDEIEEPVEEIVEEVVAEEPVEETVEEVVAEEPVEEVVEEVAVEEPVEETVEEVAVEEPVEEAVEEVAVEEPVEETVEEVVAEEPVEEVVEEVVAEEPVEETVEEVAVEEPVEETVEEEPVEEVVEEVVAEEPVEEVVEETVEDVFEEVVEDAVLEVFEEETVEETTEEIVEEVAVAEVEEPVEEVVEETPVEEVVEEVIEETPVEEVIEEVIEETPVEEVIEEVIEETPVEEVVEEVIEETPVEEVVVEAPVEEVAEETAEDDGDEEDEAEEETNGGNNPYKGRMSTKDRRKLKRAKKKNKKK